MGKYVLQEESWLASVLGEHHHFRVIIVFELKNFHQTMKNYKKVMKNDEKWWKVMKNDENRWKMKKNDEKL